MSADFRFSDAGIYSAWYGEHGATGLLDAAVYGLSELKRDEIKRARLVGNPGCYPTSALLPLVPLIKKNVINHKNIVINSVSGVSGAGRGAQAGTIFCEVNEGFKAYKIGEHRHTPEIEESLKEITGISLRVTFTPHLAPMNRGILSTIVADPVGPASTGDILSVLMEFYRDERFVRICPEGLYPDAAYVRGSNYCDIGAKVDSRAGRVIVVSAIDNLVKGAAGQAVQNMNIMFGIDEAVGLSQAPMNI